MITSNSRLSGVESIPFSTKGAALAADDADGKNMLNLLTGLNQVTATDKAADDYITRQLGIPRQNMVLASKVLSITDPAEYLLQRSKALNKIATDISKIYQDNVVLYYNAGYSTDEAIAKATQIANINYSIKAQELEATFPSSGININNKDYEKKYRKMKGHAKKQPAQQPLVEDTD
jgi:hypothetical protein